MISIYSYYASEKYRSKSMPRVSEAFYMEEEVVKGLGFSEVLFEEL